MAGSDDAAPVAGAGPALMPSEPVQEELPVLPAPVARSLERTAAGVVECAVLAFFPAARIRHAGLFLAFPALERSGLLECAKATYRALPNSFTRWNRFD